MVQAGEAARFWDKIAEKYARRPVADEASYQAKLERTRAFLRPDMELLEIGCGTGSTAIVHAPHVRSITAVDVSPAMLKIARGKARQAGISNIAFEQGAAGALDFAGSSFDMVLVLSLLHLLEDWEGLIADAHGWLRPGGLLVTSTPCLADTAPAMKYVLPLLRLIGVAPKLTFFTLDRLRQAQRDAGFEIVEEFLPGKGKSAFLVARA